MTDLKLSATTFAGLEQVLADELLSLGAKNIRKGIRSVQFEGDLGFVYKANYNIHTALHVFVQIHKVESVKNGGQLYHYISKINWTNYFNEYQNFRINVSGKSKFFKDNRFVALKAKDAIVDQFRKKTGKRPNVDTKAPDIIIQIHLQNEKIQILLDASGKSLHKRGYRSATNIAPINEVLASGIIKLIGWKGLENFLDPMCGSGTFLIEAAMSAMNIPSGINRKKFGFENWKNFDKQLFDKIKKISIDKIKELPDKVKIIGYDKAPSAIEKAKKNVTNAGLDDFIDIKHTDFFKTMRGKEKTMLLFNPPYNERISVDIQEFYKKTGDVLKHNYPDTVAWMLAGNKEVLRYMGLRTSRRIQLYNGKIEIRLVKYEMYQGSKKK